MKEGDNSKNYGSIIISKAGEVCQSLLHSVHLRREKIIISVTLDEQIVIIFSLTFFLYPCGRKGLENITYPAMDSPINGKSYDVSCIPVEDCIQKL